MQDNKKICRNYQQRGFSSFYVNPRLIPRMPDALFLIQACGLA
jgi:hypothetical protein